MEANAGEYIKNYLHLKRFPRISLHCKLVPVQYWEYEYGFFKPLVIDRAFCQTKIIQHSRRIERKIPFQGNIFAENSEDWIRRFFRPGNCWKQEIV